MLRTSKKISSLCCNFSLFTLKFKFLSSHLCFYLLQSGTKTTWLSLENIMVWRRWSWSNLQWEIAGFERLEMSAGVTQTADNHLENLLAGNNSPHPLHLLMRKVALHLNVICNVWYECQRWMYQKINWCFIQVTSLSCVCRPCDGDRCHQKWVFLSLLH